MFLSTPVKICVAALCLSSIFAGCSLWRSNENTASLAATQPRIELPFSTREPEIFQTEIVIRTGDVERLITVARDGMKRRVDYDPGTVEHRASLRTDKEYLLYFKSKRYEEQDLSGGDASGDKLLSHLLRVRDFTDFEETTRVGSIIQFRGRINDSNASEVIVFFDEAIGLPMKQEFYSIEGENRILRFTVELRGFKKEVDPAVFQVPAGFRRVGRSD